MRPLQTTRLLPSLLAGLGLLLAAPALAANAPLAGVGPVSAVHPLPLWYQDTAGVQLEPCLDTSTPNCALAAGAGLDGHGFDPALPVVFPTNFPDPINYYQLNTELPLLGNSRGLIYTANLQASFTGVSAAPTVFTQIRFVTAVNLTPNASYTITHPYGVFTLTADASGRLCPSGAKACSIIFPNPAPIGVFNGVLVANPSINPNDATLGTFLPVIVPPTGFVGDGAGRSLVTGSPTGNDLVRIVGPGIGTNASFPCSVAGTDCIENRAFTVIGQRFSPAGGPAAFLLLSGLTAGSAGVPQTVTVRAVDVNGSTATTYAGTVHFASSDPRALLPADSLLTSGTGTFSVTPRTAGAFTLTATDTVTATLTSAKGVAISPGALSALTLVSGDGQAAGVGAALPLPLTVKATDAFGNAIGGAVVTFAAPAGGSVTPTVAGTDTGGLASANATLAPTSGVQQFTASVAGVATPVTFNEDSGLPGQPVSLRLTALAAAVTAGAPAGFTVTAIDAFGNTATLADGASGALAFSSSDPAAVLPVGAQLTLGAGVFSAAFKTSGTQTLTAQLVGVPGATAGASTLVAPAAPASLSVTGLPASATAGLPAAFTVTARDAFGNLATTFAGTVSFTSSDPAAALPGASVLTSGVGAFGATFKTAGARTLTATVTGTPSATGSASTAVVAGPAANLAVAGGSGQTGAVGTALPAPLIALVTDAFGNPVGGTTVTFAAPATGSVAPASAVTGANGQASSIGTLPHGTGATSFAATAAGLTGSPVAFSATATPGAPASLTVGVPAAATAGAPFSVSVATFDAFGNPATSFNGGVTVTSSDAGAVLPVSPTLALGTGTFLVTLHGAGTQAIHAAVTSIPAATGTGTTQVTAGAATSLAVTGLATGATAGVPTGFTVTAHDAFGNVATGFAGTVSFTSSDPAAVLPGASALSSGTAAFGATFKTAGARTLTATVTGTPSATGSASTAVVAGPAANLAVAGGSGQTGAVGTALPAPLIALVTDAFGNPVGGTTVTFAAPATGSVAPASTVTGANGQASSIGTLPRGTGATSFAASVTGLAGSPIAFTATASPGAPASLTLSGAPATAVAGSPFTVSVAALDAFGNPAADFSGGVTFTSSDAGALLPAGATLALGTGTFPITLHSAGTRSVTCTVTGSAASGSATVTVQAGSASALVAASGGGQSGSAGVALAAPIVAEAVDAFGNPVSGITVTFAAPAGGAVTPGSALTGAGGTAGAVATLGGALGTQTFTAASTGLSGSPVAFAATAGPGPAAALTLAGLPAGLAAGSVASLTVTARDRFGNVATGFTGTVGFSSSDPAAALPAPAPLSAGTGTFPVTLKTTGSRTVTVAAQPASPGLTAGASTTVGPAVAATLALVSSPSSSAPVGTATASPVVVKVTDGLGNPVPGTAVAFAAPAGASISPASTSTGADGTASATPTVGTTAGSFTFTASVSGLAGSPLAFSVAATAGAGTHLALQRAAGPTALDCGCYDLTVLLQDAFGNAASQGLPGVSVTAGGQALITQTTLIATGLPSATASGALSPNGTAQVRVCDSKPEQATVAVAAAGLTGSSLALDWTLGPADATASTFTSDTATVVAWSGRAHVSVTPRSACGNPIGPGQPVALGLSGPGSITPTVDAGNGSYTATVDVAPCPAQGTTQVTARVGALDLPPLALAIACVVPSPDTTTVALSRTSVTLCDNPAKDGIDVTITPRDSGGAVMGPGQSVALAMTGLTGGTVTDVGNGTYTASFSSASCAPGSRPLTVRVNGVDLAVAGAALDFTCAPVDPARSGVSVPSGAVVADGRAAAAITVAALNTCGDPARTRAVALSASMGQLAAASGDTDAAGAFSTSLSAAQAGTATVSASVDGVALAAGHVTFSAPPAQHGGGGCSSGGSAGLLALLGLGLARRGALRRRRAPRGAQRGPGRASRVGDSASARLGPA